jgi:hypothetical protein
MKEKCTSCGISTDFDTTSDINYRSYFVEGGGQLCKRCWDRIYEVSNDDDDDFYF